jgi:hypothetical protein
VFDNLRSNITKDRSQSYKDLAPMFYRANQPHAKASQGTLDQFWLWSMQAGLKNAHKSIKAFWETDFTGDLKKFQVPTLVMHGEDDQIVPVKDSAKKSARLIKGAQEIYYTGTPHKTRRRTSGSSQRRSAGVSEEGSQRLQSSLRLRTWPEDQGRSCSRHRLSVKWRSNSLSYVFPIGGI